MVSVLKKFLGHQRSKTANSLYSYYSVFSGEKNINLLSKRFSENKILFGHIIKTKVFGIFLSFNM